MSKKGFVFSREKILDYIWEDKDIFDKRRRPLKHFENKTLQIRKRYKKYTRVGYKNFEDKCFFL
jgi:hypothetical protein